MIKPRKPRHPFAPQNLSSYTLLLFLPFHLSLPKELLSGCGVWGGARALFNNFGKLTWFHFFCSSHPLQHFHRIARVCVCAALPTLHVDVSCSSKIYELLLMIVWLFLCVACQVHQQIDLNPSDTESVLRLESLPLTPFIFSCSILLTQIATSFCYCSAAVAVA